MTGVWQSSAEITAFFLWSIVFGLFAGAFFDIFRIMRIARRSVVNLKRFSLFLRLGDGILCFLSDVVYWLVLAVGYSVFIYRWAGGRFRIGSLLCVAAGFLIWHYTLGRLVILLADRIISLIRLVIGFILSVTLVPILRLVSFFGRKIKSLFAAVFISLYHSIAVKRELSLASKGFGIDKIKRNEK